MNEFIKGNVKRIIYQTDTGYMVGIFKVKESSDKFSYLVSKSVSFTGYFHELNENDTYNFYGNIVNHPKYGEQFNVELYDRCIPEEKDSIVEFLSSGTFKGIGEKTATKIVEVLGKDGGSGAGGSGYVNDGATGGTNGGNGGLGGDNWTGGTGQGTTTREFGESSGALYAGGGGGGLGSGCKACLPDSNGKMTVDKTSVGGAGGDSTAGNGEGYKGAASCTNGKTNTGGGAGLGKRGTAQCTGGSGVVIIRNKR